MEDKNKTRAARIYAEITRGERMAVNLFVDSFLFFPFIYALLRTAGFLCIYERRNKREIIIIYETDPIARFISGSDDEKKGTRHQVHTAVIYVVTSRAVRRISRTSQLQGRIS